MTPPTPGRRPLSPIAFAVVGSEMACFTLLGVGIDSFAGTMPWATVGLTLLGTVAAMVHLIRMATPKKPPGAS